MSVTQLLEALSSSNPTPGGGTAAAIAGAMGTSLLVMVTSLSKSKNNTEDDKAALATARDGLAPIVAQLTQLASADAQSFDRVMAAYRLPKISDEEKAARAQAIQSALQGATTVPLATLRACAEALTQARVVAEFGNAAAASDTGVAIGLLRAAALGAHANVQANLDGIKNQAFKTTTGETAAQLSSAAAADAATAMRWVA